MTNNDSSTPPDGTRRIFESDFWVVVIDDDPAPWHGAHRFKTKEKAVQWMEYVNALDEENRIERERFKRSFLGRISRRLWIADEPVPPQSLCVAKVHETIVVEVADA